jgi:hypothetical protein
MNLNWNGVVKTMNLKKNNNIQTKTPVYIIEKGRRTPWATPIQVWKFTKDNEHSTEYA